MANEFIYKLKFTGNSDFISDITEALAVGIPKAAAAASAAVSSLKGSMNNLKNTLSGIKADTSFLKMLAVANMVKNAFSAMYDIGKSFVSNVLGAMTDRQGSILTFSTYFGEDQGKQVYESLLKIAKATPVATASLKEYALKYAGTFKDADSVLRASLLTADVEAFYGQALGPEKGKQIATGFTDAFNAVASGKLFEEGSEFSKSFTTGSVNGFMELAKALKITAKSGAEAKEKLSALIKSGLTGDKKQKLLDAFTDVSLKKMKSTKIGETAERISKGSLMGALSNFDSAWEDMLSGIKWEDSPAVKQITDFINKISDFIGSDRMANFIKGIAEDIASLLPEDPAKFLNGVLETIKKIYDFVKSLINGTATVGKTLVSALSFTFEKLGEAFGKGVKASLSIFGSSTGNSISGSNGNSFSPTETIRDWLSPKSIEDKLADKMDMKSTQHINVNIEGNVDKEFDINKLANVVGTAVDTSNQKNAARSGK
jgi:hypothetical protein